MQIQSKYDVVIVGAGVYGLSIAYYLSKLELKIALIEQYAIGHNNGSSHSPTRITRSTYEKQVYRDLNLRCLQKNWPEMENVLKEKLVFKSQFMYFDDNSETYGAYEKVAKSKPDNFRFMSPEQIAADYEPFPLIKSKFTPIVDINAGIIAADTYIEKLKEYLMSCPNVTISEHTTVKSIRENEREVAIETQNQFLRADKVVLSSGKWMAEMVPELKGLLNVVKQFMGYLELKDMEKYQVGKFYPFAYRANNENFFWSLPDRKNLGVKLGHHNLSRVLPEEDNTEYQQELIRKKALQIFGDRFVKVKQVEVCYYTCTKTSDFILDYTGPSERIFACSCCSGHAFKFAPIIGEIVSEILTKGRTMELFEKSGHVFKIPFHVGVNLE